MLLIAANKIISNNVEYVAYKYAQILAARLVS